MAKSGKDNDPKPERRGYALAIAALLPKVAGKALGRRGLAAGRLVADWPAIVGADLAAHCLPEKLAFPAGGREDGTLHLLAPGAWALELQHLSAQIIERVNGYFGYRAVARIKLRQGPMPAAAGRREAEAAPALDDAERQAIGRAAEGVADEGLRRALESLGAALAGAAKRPPR